MAQAKANVLSTAPSFSQETKVSLQRKLWAESTKEEFTHPLGNIDDYTVSTRIGRGKYSNVFEGHDRDHHPVVVKVLKPVRIPKINREIAILEALKGCHYIAQLQDVVKDIDSGSIALILNWTINTDIRNLCFKMNTNDIAIYTYKVLMALSAAHSRGIMHRDIKPGNIMYNHETKDVCVIDWGLAEVYVPGMEYQVRVATKHYKGPELLLGYPFYDYGLDIWCLGCTLAGLLFRRIPFFRGHDNDEQIVKMCAVLGGDGMLKYAEKYNLELSASLKSKIAPMKGRFWMPFYNEENRSVITPEALDLLDKMLTIDHQERPTADEALRHPFFDSIRGKV